MFLLCGTLTALLVCGGCSDSELCESCEVDDDCEGDLACAQFEDGSWRCVDSIWTSCTTKSHVTAP